ncbi:MAG TPA: hypothetical protein VIM33_06555 [Gaiellaceae bacterium]|jgi:hypothetical protein
MPGIVAVVAALRVMADSERGYHLGVRTRGLCCELGADLADCLPML